jgi:hypothetical protein
MTKPCIFCGVECIFDEDDEGCGGVVIGNNVICGGLSFPPKTGQGV